MEADLQLTSLELDEDSNEIPSGPRWKARYLASVRGIAHFSFEVGVIAREPSTERGIISPATALRFADRRAAELFQRLAEVARDKLKEAPPH